MNKIPFFLFLILMAIFTVPLLSGKDPAVVDSALIGKPAPGFESQGAPSLVNFFASWCLECRVEHATLAKISREENIPLYGIDYKDTPEKLTAWLEKFGNIYTAIVTDPDGRKAMDWGVYGVPETFIVDAEGIIRYKHVGAVTEKVYQDIFRPLLAELKK